MSQRSRHGCANGGSHRKCGESIQITEIGPQMVGHSCKDPPFPSNYCIFWMSCFLKSRLFAKIAEICIWPQRCTRSQKVTEGGEIKIHVTKKLRKGARFHNRPCGRHAAPNITFRFPFWLFWFLSKFDSALFSYSLGLYSRECGIGDAHAPRMC